MLETLRGQSINMVIDVGANAGGWSLMAAELFPEATLYALEVVPDTAATLRANAARQPRIKCFNLGLAAHSGTMSLRYHAAASTHATFTEYPHGWTGKRIECPAEHLVLQGLADLLREQRARFVQFEYGRVNILTHFLLRDFYELFGSYGYLVGNIYPD